MKIIENIINASIVSQNIGINIKNISSIDSVNGTVVGLHFDADVQLKYLYDSIKRFSAYEKPLRFPGFFDEMPEEHLIEYLDVLKKSRNDGYHIDHLRFPINYQKGIEVGFCSNYSITSSEYNNERFHYIFSLRKPGLVHSVFEERLSEFFGFISFELHNILKDAANLAIDVLDKMKRESIERCIKQFVYRDCYSTYDVQLFSKGLPEHILGELIAPDILLSKKAFSSKIISNAKRYLNGKTNSVYIKYEAMFHSVNTSDEPKMMSDREMFNRHDLKNFAKVFFKECHRSGREEYGNY